MSPARIETEARAAVALLVILATTPLAAQEQAKAAGDAAVAIHVVSAGVLGREIPNPLFHTLRPGHDTVSFFSVDRATGRYVGNHPEGTVTRATVSVDPGHHLSGGFLRHRFPELLGEGGRVELPGGGGLELAENGTMAFTDIRFNGHAVLHHDRTFSVWTTKGRPIIVLAPRGPRTLILVEDSKWGARLFGRIFGARLAADWGEPEDAPPLDPSGPLR